jgi:dTDP-4-amino-4,6-dideoxygalactose transaminase
MKNLTSIFYSGIYWQTKWLTNNGPILRRFTQELCNFFETDNLCIFNNGTLALQIAMQVYEFVKFKGLITPAHSGITVHSHLSVRCSSC